MQNLVKRLNNLYRQSPALYQLDHKVEGFEWLDSANAEQSIFSFVRYAKGKQQAIVCISNMTPQVHHNFGLGVPLAGQYQQLLNTDDASYEGSHQGIFETIETVDEPNHGFEQSLSLTIPPLATLWLQWQG